MHVFRDRVRWFILSTGTAVFLVGGVSVDAAVPISSLLTGRHLRDAIQKTEAVFSRPSPAYTNDATPVADHQPRFEPLAVSSVFEEQWLTADAGPGARVLFNGTFLGVRTIYHDHPDQRTLFQSNDAVTWQPLYTFNYDIVSVFVTPGNAILVCTITPKPGRIFRSADGGQTFDLVQVLPADGGYVRHWNYAVLNGAIYVGEYGTKTLPNNARHILRSDDDGRTWQIEYAPPEQNSYHVHKVLADPFAGCIWQANGDQSSNAIKRSCLGGPWEVVSGGLAPTAGIARADGIYWGSDFHVTTWATVERFDRLTGTYHAKLYVDQGGYVWDMAEHGSILYATLYNYQRTVTPTLWASRSGNEWVLLREYPLGESGVEIFGPVRDGWVYTSYLDGVTAGYRNYRYKIPKVRDVAGIRIEPPAENLLATAQNSSAEQGTNGWVAYNWGGGTGAQIAQDTAIAHHGSASIHVTSAPGSHRPGVRTPQAVGNFPAGTTLTGSLWVKGPSATLRGNLVDRTNGIEGPRLRVRLTNEWHRVIVRQTLPFNANSVDLVIYENSDSAEADFHVDSAAIYADTRSMTWQLGGTNRAGESLTHAIAYPSSWTETWHWKTDQASDDPLVRPLVIKSWSNPAGDSLRLAYEPIDRSFKLFFDAGAGPQVLLATPSLSFRKDSLFHMAVTYSPVTVELYLFSPVGRFHLTGVSSGVGFDRTWIGSTPLADDQAGGIFAHHSTYNDVMTEVEIIAALDQALIGSDLDADGDVDVFDFLTFTNCFNGSLRPMPATCFGSLSDLDNDGDVDAFDFLTFANCFNGALNPPSSGCLP